jgi:hypothetical protein
MDKREFNKKEILKILSKRESREVKEENVKITLDSAMEIATGFYNLGQQDFADELKKEIEKLLRGMSNKWGLYDGNDTKGLMFINDRVLEIIEKLD